MLHFQLLVPSNHAASLPYPSGRSLSLSLSLSLSVPSSPFTYFVFLLSLRAGPKLMQAVCVIIYLQLVYMKSEPPESLQSIGHN